MNNKHDNEALEHGIDAPGWIDANITLGDIISISNHGCANYCYMPAVAYYEAKRIMGMWGDEVIEYILDHQDMPIDCILEDHKPESFGQICCTLLSFAVELWCWSHYDAVEEILNEDEDEDEEGVAA